MENEQLTPTLLLPTRTGSHEPAGRGQQLLSRLRKSSRRTSALSLGRRALLISDASAGRRDTPRSVPSASLVIQGCLAVATERQSQVTAGRSSSTAASPAAVVIWARAPPALSDVVQCATLPWSPATAAPECASATRIVADVSGSFNSRLAPLLVVASSRRMGRAPLLVTFTPGGRCPRCGGQSWSGSS